MTRNERIELLSNLSIDYQNSNFLDAYNKAETLANYYLSKDDFNNYCNYTNKSINYYSKLDADSALILQKNLILESFASNRLDEVWAKVILDQFINILQQNLKIDHDFSFLEEQLRSTPKDEPIYPYIEFTLGLSYQHIENFPKSTLYFKKAIQDGIEDVYSVLIKIGKNAYSQGNYGLALDAFTQTVEYCQTRFDQATVTNYMGNCLYKLDDFKQALALYELSRNIRREISSNSDLLAIINQNIGNSFRTINKDSAEFHYRKAIHNALNTNPLDLKLLANSYNNIGNMFLENKELDSALLYFKKAYLIRKDSVTENSFYISQSLYNLSTTFLSMGKLHQAISYAKESLHYQDSIDQKNLKRTGSYSYSYPNYDRFYTTKLLGDSYFKLFENKRNTNLLEISLDYFYDALDYIKEHQKNIHEEKAKLIKAGEKKQLILNAIRAQFVLDSILNTKNPERIKLLMGESHNSVLHDLILEKQVRKTRALSITHKSLSQKLSEKHSYNLNFMQLDSIVQTIDVKNGSASDIPSDTFDNQIKIKKQDSEVSPQTKLANPKEISLVFIVDHNQSMIYYLIDQGNHLVYDFMDSDTLFQEIEKLEEAFREYDFIKSDHSLNRISQLLHPITSRFQNFDKNAKLVITPDAELWTLPFDAIQIERHGQLHYLVEFFEICLGVTPFSNSPNFSMEATLSKSVEANWVGFAPVQFASQNIALSNLPNSLKEISSISKLLKPNLNVQTLTFSDASLKNLYRYSSGAFFHFATHNYHNPATGFSEIILKSPSGLENLSYDNILLNDVCPRYVFLNICSGFVGEYIAGEGPINLSRAFLLNGTQQVIYTLYRTPDLFASKFALAYYQNMKQTGHPREALTDTKRYFLQQTPYKSPIFWSNYQVITID